MNGYKRSRLYRILHPEPLVGKTDTSLRYTDILFGFVIRELFQRLSNFLDLQPVIQAHLVVGTVLVLGSWIGYRRSLYRSSYEVKFFNIPLLKFLVDQLMLILYFRIATVTPVSPSMPPPLLAQTTLGLVFFTFLLYIIWDALGLIQTSVSVNGMPVYPKVAGGKMTAEREPRNWSGLLITMTCLLALGALWLVLPHIGPVLSLYLAAFLLLLYRWCKENRWILEEVLAWIFAQ